MSETEPLYDGPDPLLKGATAKWAALLRTRPPVPRTIGAVLLRLPDEWRARAYLEIHAAGHGPDLDDALGRWWRVALQGCTREEVLERAAYLTAHPGELRDAPEVIPGWDEFCAGRAARSDAEKAADDARFWREREQWEDERREQSRQYLAALERLAAEERAYTARLDADRQRREA